jgi:hypothetical protein
VIKGGALIAAAIAIAVGAFAALIIGGVLFIPLSGLAPLVQSATLLLIVRLVIFAAVFAVVFPEMREKFTR